MVTGVCTAPYIKYERDYADYTPQKIQDTKVIQISDPLGFSEAIKSPKLTIVNFYQSSFNPCKYFNPKFAKLAADMSQYARFVQVSPFRITGHYRPSGHFRPSGYFRPSGHFRPNDQ